MCFLYKSFAVGCAGPQVGVRKHVFCTRRIHCYIYAVFALSIMYWQQAHNCFQGQKTTHAVRTEYLQFKHHKKQCTLPLQNTNSEWLWAGCMLVFEIPNLSAWILSCVGFPYARWPPTLQTSGHFRSKLVQNQKRIENKKIPKQTFHSMSCLNWVLIKFKLILKPQWYRILMQV